MSKVRGWTEGKNLTDGQGHTEKHPSADEIVDIHVAEAVLLMTLQKVIIYVFYVTKYWSSLVKSIMPIQDSCILQPLRAVSSQWRYKTQQSIE